MLRSLYDMGLPGMCHDQHGAHTPIAQPSASFSPTSAVLRPRPSGLHTQLSIACSSARQSLPPRHLSKTTMGQTPSFVTSETFSPALGNTHTVAVPPSSAHGGVQLLFKADLRSAEALAQYEKSGMQIQAWTDAPVEGHSPGEWAAYTFNKQAISYEDEAVTASASEFLLLAPEDEHVEEPYVLHLRLQLHAGGITPNQSEARFLLTYRLLFPDGHVHWLGEPGRDVVCVLKREDPWLAVRDGWVARSEPEEEETPAFVWEHVGPSPSGGNIQFARIRQALWGCWAIGFQSAKYFRPGTQITDASYLIFLPRVHPTTFTLHDPIVLRSPPGTLSLSPSGLVTCPAGSHIEIYRELPIASKLLDDIDSHGLRFIGEQAGYALIASPGDQSPARIAFVPLVHLKPSTRLICSGFERSLFGDDGAKRYMLFCPASLQMFAYATDPDIVLVLRLGAAGGKCVLSHVYTLPGYADEELESADQRSLDQDQSAYWALSIFTPHIFVPPPPPSEHERSFEVESQEGHVPAHEPVREQVASFQASSLTHIERRSPQEVTAALMRTLILILQAAVLQFISLAFRPGDIPAFDSSASKRRELAEGEEDDEQTPIIGAYEKEKLEDDRGLYKSDFNDTDTETLANTEVHSASGTSGAALTFNIPEGPFHFVHRRPTRNSNALNMEVLLEGEKVDLNEGNGWTLTVVDGVVKGGRAEVFLNPENSESEV